jgi:hypothetical protein
MDQDLVEGVDYIVEDGFFVFTRSYLLRRGSCCENGCRHCPYGFHERGSGDGKAPAEGKTGRTLPGNPDDAARVRGNA